MTAANGNRAASATWLTGLTFTALAAPLAMFGAEPLDISLGNVNIRGPLDDYAMEYLGAAAAISLGFGASRLMKASGESQKAAVDSGLAQSTAASVEPLMSWANSDSSLLTEASLKASGLHLFLDEDDAPMVVRSTSGEQATGAVEMFHEPSPASSPQPQSSQVSQQDRPVDSAQPVPQPLPTQEALATIVAEVQSIVQQMAVQSQEVAAAQAVAPAMVQHPVTAVTQPAVRVAVLPLTNHHTAPIFPAAQSYVSFARSKGIAEQSITRDLTAELAVLDQIHQVREQMQHLMNQVDLIQADLEQTVYPAQRLVPLRAAQAPSYTVSAVEPLRTATAEAPDVWSNYRATA